MYVDALSEGSRTRVRFPPPPPDFASDFRVEVRSYVSACHQTLFRTTREAQSEVKSAAPKLLREGGQPFHRVFRSNFVARHESDFRVEVRSFTSARHQGFLIHLNKAEPFRVEAVRRRRMNFYYVYILHSEVDHERFYTGFTEDLDSRLKAHNSGNVPHTSKYKPWRIKTAIAFINRQKAIEFEKYLKTPSGRAFAKKRL
jgi:putative endonuclease